MNNKGFTLIELLVAIAITGILATAAVVNFIEYRQATFNTVAQSDLRTAVTAQEAYFTDNTEYLPCNDAIGCEQLPGFLASKDPNGVASLNTFNFEVSENNFVGTARHKSGTKTFMVDSTEGNIRETP